MSTAIPTTRDIESVFSVYFFSNEIPDSKPRTLYNQLLYPQPQYKKQNTII